MCLLYIIISVLIYIYIYNIYVTTVFLFDLDDHKNKWSRHRSFLYGCDRSPKMHVLKLGTEIPNLKQHNWSMKLI